MKLSDLILDGNGYTVLCGEHCVEREFREIHLVSTAADLCSIQPGSLLFVFHRIFTESFTPSVLFSAALRQGVTGIVLTGAPGFTLTEQQRNRLSAGSTFVLLLPPAADFHSIICQKQAEFPEVYQSEVLLQLRSELAGLCSRPYTALDVAELVNKALGRSVDLVVGPELHSLTQHDTLHTVNVTSILSRNLDRVLSCPSPQIYCNQSCRAMIVRILDLYAFVAIPLKYERAISELELAMTMEAIPYLALALAHYKPQSSIDSADALYRELLRGEHTLSPLALRETASFLGINSDTPRYVWILEWQEEIPTVVRSTLKKRIQETFPASFIYSQERRHVVVSPSAELRPGDQSPVFTLRQLLQGIWADHPQIRLCISVSKTCASLRHLKKAYDEAKFSMIIGPKLDAQKNIHDFRAYMLYQALCSCWGEPILEKVHKSIILPIRDYDAANRMSLLSTLEQYAACAFNISKTAEVMQVHRNTLYRRIAKIGAILNLDMNASDTHILLYIALRIDHIIQILPQTEKNMSWTM